MLKINHVVLITLLVASYASVAWVRSGYSFTVAPPDFVLADLPLELGPWRGEELSIQDDTIRVMNAHSFVNRVYRDSIGRSVSMHAAVWTKAAEVGQTTPHHPQVCYPAAGWEIMGRRKTSFDLAGTQVPMECMLLQRRGESVVVGHWYEMGDKVFTSPDQGVTALCSLWGEPIWPSSVKFLVQTPGNSLADAEPLLIEFCSLMRTTLKTE